MTFSEILSDILTSLIYLLCWRKCVKRRSYYKQPQRRHHDVGGLLLSIVCGWWSYRRACPEVRRCLYLLCPLVRWWYEGTTSPPATPWSQSTWRRTGRPRGSSWRRRRRRTVGCLILRGDLAREIHPLSSSWTLISTGGTGDTKVGERERETDHWQYPRSPPGHHPANREFRLVPPAGPGSRAEWRERQPGGQLHVAPAQHQPPPGLPGQAELQPDRQGPPRHPAEPDLHLALAQLRPRRYQVHGLAGQG